jgi:hypothetical protein
VAEHGNVHTAKNGTAKNLCHVPFCGKETMGKKRVERREK